MSDTNKKVDGIPLFENKRGSLYVKLSPEMYDRLQSFNVGDLLAVDITFGYKSKGESESLLRGFIKKVETAANEGGI